MILETTSRAICKAMSVLKFKWASRKCANIHPGNLERLSCRLYLKMFKARVNNAQNKHLDVQKYRPTIRVVWPTNGFSQLALTLSNSNDLTVLVTYAYELIVIGWHISAGGLIPMGTFTTLDHFSGLTLAPLRFHIRSVITGLLFHEFIGLVRLERELTC